MLKETTQMIGKFHYGLAALCVLFCAGMAQAEETETITVTVSLGSQVSVSLDKNSWNIGPVHLNSASTTATFTATNSGNIPERLTISATNGANGWNVGRKAADTFQVDVLDPAISLTTSAQELAPSVAMGQNKPFALNFKSPTSDTKGGGKDHSFSIVVTASAQP